MKDFSQAFFTIFLHLNKLHIHKMSLCVAVFIPPPQCQLHLQVLFNPLGMGGTLKQQIDCFCQRLRYPHFLSFPPAPPLPAMSQVFFSTKGVSEVPFRACQCYFPALSW